jgi:hypothetical protein
MVDRERYIILNAARRVLREIEHEARSAYDERYAPAIMAKADTAEDAVFMVLNWEATYSDNKLADDALSEFNANRDLDPEVLIAALRLSERERHPAQVCSDGEHEADIEAGDMLGRRP